MRGFAHYSVSIITAFGVWLSTYGYLSLATSPEEKLFDSISQLTVTGDREPSTGAIRTVKSETDIRKLIEAPDQREVIISIWSPRVHPFKEPPT